MSSQIDDKFRKGGVSRQAHDVLQRIWTRKESEHCGKHAVSCSLRWMPRNVGPFVMQEALWRLRLWGFHSARQDSSLDARAAPLLGLRPLGASGRNVPCAGALGVVLDVLLRNSMTSRSCHGIIPAFYLSSVCGTLMSSLSEDY